MYEGDCLPDLKQSVTHLFYYLLNQNVHDLSSNDHMKRLNIISVLKIKETLRRIVSTFIVANCCRKCHLLINDDD